MAGVGEGVYHESGKVSTWGLKTFLVGRLKEKRTQQTEAAFRGSTRAAIVSAAGT